MNRHSKCCSYYLQKFFKFNYNQVTIIDKNIKTFDFPTVQMIKDKGAKLLHYNIRRDNVNDLLDNILHVQKYDIVIDLSTNTSTYTIFKECRLRGLLYINTSIEDDKPIRINKECPIDNGIFLQHVNIQSIAHKTRDNGNITSVIEFGMNPGLISVFVKQGIIDMAKMVLKYQTKHKKVNPLLSKYYKKRDHKHLAEILKIRTIHCSEIDTQIPKRMPKEKFINTWSCVGLITEGVEPAEIQIGTHEKTLPFDSKNVTEIIPQLIMTQTAGQDIKVKSIVPLKINSKGKVEFTYIQGRCIHHGEGISLNRFLGTFKYSPTMHYVYQLNPITDKMLSDFSKNELVNISKDDSQWKVLNTYEDKIEGYDNVGALFILEENPLTGGNEPYCFWTGSILDTKYTRETLKDIYFGPTVIQVMAGILSSVRWMLENRKSGLLFGEDIDDNYIIKHAKKYLGKYYSGPVTGDFKLQHTTLNELIVEGADTNTMNVADL
jgi:homospermidine synthase